MQGQQPMIEMPKYKCHKEVHALKILSISDGGRDGGKWLWFESPYAAQSIDAKWYEKHNPHMGGYYVVYEDGYTSFSPAAAFEKGYTKL